jgi:hypothetical protein
MNNGFNYKILIEDLQQVKPELEKMVVVLEEEKVGIDLDQSTEENYITYFTYICDRWTTPQRVKTILNIINNLEKETT